METKFETEQLFHLTDALNYTKGQVEFRTIMATHNGSADLVALQAESHLAEHPAPDDVLVLLLEGEAEFHIKGYDERLLPGDSLLLRKGTPHSVKPLKDSKILLVKIRP